MSLSSIIGQASRGADLYFVFRFLRLLTMDYKKTDAFKFGIIDNKGKALRKSADLESIKEKAAYTMLHRMVFKIRRLMEKIPGGRFVNYAAALFLLKEQKDARIWTDGGYMKSKLLEFLETDWEADAKFLKEEVDNMDKKSFKSFLSENKTIEESQELQAMMALDDAGIEAVIDKKGKIVINKKDKKNAEKALKKSFRKGGAPEIQYEEVELSEEVADIMIRKGVGKMSKQQVAGKVMTNARKLFGLDASVNGMFVRISGSKKKVNDYLAVIIGRSSSGDATQQGDTYSNPNIDKQLTKDLKTAHGGIGPGLYREDVEMDEAKGTAYPATVDTLRKIVKDKQHQTVMFDKGQALVDLFTASAMVQVYDALKPATKKKFEDMIKSKEGFMKSQAFAMKMIG